MSETPAEHSDHAANRPSWTVYLVGCLFTYAALSGLWLLFTANLSKPEILVGLGAAAVATAATMIFQSVALVAFRPRLRDWAQAWRIPWYMIKGMWELLQALGRQLFTQAGTESIVYAVPFDVGGDDSASAGRRALAITYTTLTPNFVIIGIVREQRLLLYHQVVTGPVVEMTRKLGAES